MLYISAKVQATVHEITGEISVKQRVSKNVVCRDLADGMDTRAYYVLSSTLGKGHVSQHFIKAKVVGRKTNKPHAFLRVL